MLPILRILPVGGVFLAIMLLVLGLNPPAGPQARLTSIGAPVRGAMIDRKEHPEWPQFLMLAAIQRAFVDHGGAQCGICTPGMILAACELLERIPRPRPADIREALAGNICRCTGYIRIFESVVQVLAIERGIRAR